MTLDKKHSVYFIGIGGIGMSALARWFLLQGKKVAGYDRTETPLTRKLQAEGIDVHYHDQTDLIPENIRNDQENTLVVFTPAIPKNHQEFNFLQSKGFEIRKRSEVLGMITRNLYTVAVAGTHGKTTTSSMIAHILKTAARDSVAFLGGIVQGYESNLIIQGEPSDKTITVVEADEYDRSFLRLFPDIAVITSADADHLDIYQDHESLKSSFRDFIRNIHPDGMLYIKHAIANELLNQFTMKHQTYALDSGDNRAENIRVEGGYFRFDYESRAQRIRDLKLSIPGYHNIENAIAAISVALNLGIDGISIRNALENFGGVKRRFEYVIKSKKLVYIDDYAHHPAEISAFLKSVKALYPNRKVTAIFQPHLFTRTRDFADGFAQSLEVVDEIWLMDIYPARELPLPGVTSELILG